MNQLGYGAGQFLAKQRKGGRGGAWSPRKQHTVALKERSGEEKRGGATPKQRNSRVKAPEGVGRRKPDESSGEVAGEAVGGDRGTGHS